MPPLPALHPSSSPAAVSLLREVLRGGRPLESEYPLVFQPGAPGGVLSIEDERGTLVSACTTLERRLIAPQGAFSAGLIGSVATHPERRGEGHGQRLLRAAEERFARDGCLLTLLWADEPGFYERRGYLPLGFELDWPIAPQDAIRLPELIGVRAARAEDAPRLHELYLTHIARVERSLAETRALLLVPAVRTLVLERSGTIVAYACRGRGDDLANAVHEWAGEPLAVLALVRAHLVEYADTLVLMAPPAAREIAHYLDIVGIAGRRGYLGLGKLLSLARAAEMISAAGAETIVTGEQLVVRGPRGSAVLDATQALFCILPPRGNRAVVRVLEKEIGCELAALPWTPFVWGLDSI